MFYYINNAIRKCKYVYRHDPVPGITRRFNWKCSKRYVSATQRLKEKGRVLDQQDDPTVNFNFGRWSKKTLPNDRSYYRDAPKYNVRTWKRYRNTQYR